MKSISLIVDGNYHVHRSLDILISTDKWSMPFLKNENEKSLLLEKLARDLVFESNRLMSSNGRLVFVADSASWRKNIDGGENYKANRKDQKERYVKEAFYDVVEQFGEMIRSVGGIFHKTDGAEGDDLIHLWSKKLLKEGHSSIILSSDKDLHSLVECKNDTFIAAWRNNNKKNELFVGKGFEEVLNHKDISLFDLDGSGHNMIVDEFKRKFIDINNIEFVTVDVPYFVFEKILTGDDGDNVPSIVRHKKNNRTYQITTRMAGKIWNTITMSRGKFNVMDMWKDEDLCYDIANLAFSQLKVSPSPEKLRECVNRIYLNIRMMYLHPLFIPQELKTDIIDYIKESYSEMGSFNATNSQDIVGNIVEKSTEDANFVFGNI